MGRADYNEWGQITYKDALDITSSYRRIYPQLSYTGHDWDDVLGMYYAKARFYDADTKRFVAIDPIKGNVTDPLSLVPYIYCVDNPLRWVDPLGLTITAIGGHKLEITPVTLGDGEYIAIRDLLAACNINLPKQETSSGIYSVTTPVAGGMNITATMDTSKKELTLTALSKRSGGNLPKTVVIAGTYSPEHAYLPYHMTMYNGNYFMKIECFKAAMKSIGFDAQLKPTEAIQSGLVTKEQMQAFGWHNITNAQLNELNQVMEKYEINTPLRIAFFLGNLKTESSDFTRTLEKYDTYPDQGIYTAEDYFNSEYDHTNGNRSGTNDGELFRGSGFIQLTGRKTYQAFANYIGDPEIMTQGYKIVGGTYNRPTSEIGKADGLEVIDLGKYAFESAGWFWTHSVTGNLNPAADAKDWDKMRRGINGGEAKSVFIKRNKNVNEFYKILTGQELGLPVSAEQ